MGDIFWTKEKENKNKDKMGYRCQNLPLKVSIKSLSSLRFVTPLFKLILLVYEMAVAFWTWTRARRAGVFPLKVILHETIRNNDV